MKSFDGRPPDRYAVGGRRAVPSAHRPRVEQELRMTLNLSAVGFKSAAHTVAYDWKTVVLYALGIGAKKSELSYLYEGRGPKVYPTFGVCPVFAPVFECLEQTGGNAAMI